MIAMFSIAPAMCMDARTRAAHAARAGATAIETITGTTWYGGFPGSSRVVSNHKHAHRWPPSPTT